MNREQDTGYSPMREQEYTKKQPWLVPGMDQKIYAVTVTDRTAEVFDPEGNPTRSFLVGKKTGKLLEMLEASAAPGTIFTRDIVPSVTHDTVALANVIRNTNKRFSTQTQGAIPRIVTGINPERHDVQGAYILDRTMTTEHIDGMITGVVSSALDAYEQCHTPKHIKTDTHQLRFYPGYIAMDNIKQADRPKDPHVSRIRYAKAEILSPSVGPTKDWIIIDVTDPATDECTTHRHMCEGIQSDAFSYLIQGIPFQTADLSQNPQVAQKEIEALRVALPEGMMRTVHVTQRHRFFALWTTDVIRHFSDTARSYLEERKKEIAAGRDKNVRSIALPGNRTVHALDAVITPAGCPYLAVEYPNTGDHPAVSLERDAEAFTLLWNALRVLPEPISLRDPEIIIDKTRKSSVGYYSQDRVYRVRRIQEMFERLQIADAVRAGIRKMNDIPYMMVSTLSPEYAFLHCPPELRRKSFPVIDGLGNNGGKTLFVVSAEGSESDSDALYAAETTGTRQDEPVFFSLSTREHALIQSAINGTTLTPSPTVEEIMRLAEKTLPFLGSGIVRLQAKGSDRLIILNGDPTQHRRDTTVSRVSKAESDGSFNGVIKGTRRY